MDQNENANNMALGPCQNCDGLRELASTTLELLVYVLDPARTPFELMTIRMQVNDMIRIMAGAQPPNDNPDTHKPGT